MAAMAERVQSYGSDCFAKGTMLPDDYRLSLSIPSLPSMITIQKCENKMTMLHLVSCWISLGPGDIIGAKNHNPSLPISLQTKLTKHSQGSLK